MRIGTVRAQRLAVSEFGGFATGAEVRRQRDALLRQLQRDGAPLCDPSGEAYVLMQYNPPYTLPWLRTNEVALPVDETPPPASSVEEDAPSPAAAAEAVEADDDSAPSDMD